MGANRLDDGFKTLITFANKPLIKLYEKEVTQPALTGGGAIDTTTMRNTAWRTMAPKTLKSLSPLQATCAYAPDVFTDVLTQLHTNQLITITMPDGSTFHFYGYLESFTPAANKEGDQPTAAVVIQPTLVNLSGVETAPEYHLAAS